VSDVCDTSPTVTFSDVTTAGPCPQSYKVTRTWTATDHCGNHASCSQAITVVDTMPPSITCPADFSVAHLADVPPCPTSLAAFLALGGTASDICDSSLQYFCSDGALVVNGCSGTITRTHTVIDDCGNRASCPQ